MNTALRKAILLFLWVMVSLQIAGCVNIPDAQYEISTKPQSIGSGYNSRFMILEIKDDGSFHDPKQVEGLKAWLGNDSNPLVVFVHGWHHNANPRDLHRIGFIGFVKDLEKRCKTVAGACASISAVYVGWRGDEEDTLLGPEPLDFLTLRTRKEATRVIGRGAFRELVNYLRAEVRNRPVVIAGHSLGGSIVFYAMSDSLNATASDRFEYILVNPAVGTREFSSVETSLNNQAALVRSSVLPPELSRIDEAMTRANRKLTALQATGDTAISNFYSMAFAGDKPIGFDETWITHRAFACTRSSKECHPEGGSENDLNGAFEKVQVERGLAPDYCSVVFAKGKLVLRTIPEKNDEICWKRFSRPVWVVAVDPAISKSHNDIFNGVYASALADLIVQRLRFKPSD
jgi:hypothetical protein